MRRLTKCLNISRKEKNLLLRCRESIHKISPKAKVIQLVDRRDACPTEASAMLNKLCYISWDCFVALLLAMTKLYFP